MSVHAEREIERIEAHAAFELRMGTPAHLCEAPLREALVDALDENGRLADELESVAERAGDYADEAKAAEKRAEKLAEEKQDLERERDLLADEVNALRAKLAAVESAQTERPVGVQRSKPRKP